MKDQRGSYDPRKQEKRDSKDKMGDNTKTNKEVTDAANAVGGLTRAQRERLHRLISQQNYTYQQILEFAKAIKAGQL